MTEEIVWSALGKYLSGKLSLKQGVIVPKLGTFTFIHKNGETPTFIPSLELGTGSSARPRSATKSLLTRLNYSELASIANLTETQVKSSLESAVQNTIASIKSGALQSKEVPLVGTLLIKNNQLSIDFYLPKKRVSYSEQDFPVTQLDLTKLLKENKAKFTLMCQSKDPTGQNSVPIEDFKSILKGLTAEEITDQSISQFLNQSKAKTGSVVRYKDILRTLDPKTIAKSRSAGTIFTDFTANYNKASVMPFAKEIWKHKVNVMEESKTKGMRPGVPIAPTQLLSVLRKAGLALNIHQLKALLREIGMYSASPVQLLKGIQSLFLPQEEVSVFSDILSSKSSVAPSNFKDQNIEKIKSALKDYNRSEVYTRAKRGPELLVDDFVDYMVNLTSGKVKQVEARQAFLKASGQKQVIDEKKFVNAFRESESFREVVHRCTKKLKDWLTAKQTTTEEGFSQIVKNFGSGGALSREQFRKAMSEFGMGWTDSDMLFRALDSKQDNQVDISEWCNLIYQETGPIQSFRDTILKHGLQPEDLIVKLNTPGSSHIEVGDLAQKLSRIDPSLGPKTAVSLATAAAGTKGYVNLRDLIDKLSYSPGSYKVDWKSYTLEVVRKNLGNRIPQLRCMFEDCDSASKGQVTVFEFQDCLHKAEVGLNEKEIQRLATCLKTQTDTVNYYEFLESLEKTQTKESFHSVVNRIKAFIKQNKITTAELLNKLGQEVDLDKFADFLNTKIIKQASKATLLEIAQKFDINRDGQIDINDLSICLRNTESASWSHYSKDKVKSIIQDVKAALVEKRISYSEAFKNIDKNANGLVSLNEFSEGLKGIIELSEPMKGEIFRVMDKHKIGLVDYPNFLRVVKDTQLESTESTDSWNWESGVLNSVKTWIAKEDLTVEDAFRAFDRNFDGVLSLNDLQKALVEVLEVKNATPTKVERLYKLMDTYKRNSVHLADFKVLFEEKRSPEWKSAAKQQIGLFLCRKYTSTATSFEQVSKFSDKVTFEHFQQWVDANQALRGFNLTRDLYQQLFAYLDPHRKGYLSMKDWETAFGKFNYSLQSFQEIKDAIRSNFCDINAAFQFFLSYHKQSPPNKIGKKDFVEAVQALIPKRFSQSDIKQVWSSFSKPFLGFHDFRAEFGQGKFMSTFSHSSRSTGLSSGFSSEEPLKKLQALIRASPYSLEDVFKQMDTDSSGVISAIEFRKAIRKLGLGLTAKDIDALLSRIDTNNDGQIDWQEFSKRFKTSNTEKQVKAAAQSKLNKLRELMTAFMLSPKDAFKQFDSERLGFLRFQNFSDLLKKLSELNKEPLPSFSVLKDLFDIIDIRKDGVLDMREWLNTFKEAKQTSWEDSRQFEDICKSISKNRKLLQLSLDGVAQSGKVDFSQAKEVIGGILKERLTQPQWTKLLQPATQDGRVDYRFLLEVYKDRASSLHPKP